jgi:hypothetical protein
LPRHGAPRTRRSAPASVTRPARTAVSVRRHVSPATRAALARTRALRIDLGSLEVLGIASAPPDEHEAPLVLHPLAIGGDALVVISLDELPPRAPHAGHPVLLQLGERARGYVRDRRRVRRRAIGRHAAALMLGGGVLAAMATVGFAGADGAVGGPLARAHSNTAFDAAGVVGANTPPRAEQKSGPILVKTVAAPSAGKAPTTDAPVATSAGFPGAWAFKGDRRVWVPYPANASDPFLVCTRANESIDAGGYRAVDDNGVHFGAYQFLRSTWNNVARRVERFSLVGVNPRDASPSDQDWMALYLYRWEGASHWQGRCAGL